MKIYYDNLEELKLNGVYLIRNLDNNLLKIGRCSDLQRRFKEIKGAFKHIGVDPNLKIECFIEYEYNTQLERYLHKKFKDNRIQNEWFEINNIDPIILSLNDFKFKPETTIRTRELSKNKNSNKEIKLELKYYKFNFYFGKEWYTIAFRSYYKEVNFSYLNSICHELGYNQKYNYFYEYYNDIIEDEDIKECEELEDQFKNINCNYIVKVNDDWISIKEFLKPIILNIKKKEIDQIKMTLTNVINDFDNIDLNNYEDIKRVYSKMYEDIENQLYLDTLYYSKRYIRK